MQRSSVASPLAPVWQSDGSASVAASSVEPSFEAASAAVASFVVESGAASRGDEVSAPLSRGAWDELLQAPPSNSVKVDRPNSPAIHPERHRGR